MEAYPGDSFLECNDLVFFRHNILINCSIVLIQHNTVYIYRRFVGVTSLIVLKAYKPYKQYIPCQY